jgi:tetratricopeptide (TPR) repeat protein
MGNVEEQLNSLSNMAGAYYKMGNFIESAQACQKTLEIARALSHGLFQAQACHLLAKDCLAMGNFKLAFQMLSEAKNICNDLSNSELNVDILQTGIELELNCGDIDAARNLLAQVGESHSLTPYQELKKLWLEAIMAQAEKDKRSGELFKSLSERLKKTSHVELTGQSILGLAKSCSESPDFAKAKEYLREFDNLEISDLLLRLEVDLLRLELLVYECKYDEALGLAKKIKVQADQSGCSLVMFAAMVRETEIYSRCGKASLKEKSLRQAEKIRRSLVAAFPEEKDIKLFENIPAFGLYKRISGGKEKEIAKP